MPTLTDIFTALTGRPAPAGSVAIPISQFLVDSRAVVPGSCFVARPGAQVDGHTFIPQVLAAGATAVLADRHRVPPTVAATVVDLDVPDAAPALQPPVLFLTGDSMEAIQRFAGWWRDQATKLRAIGITGSVGKTTLKELTAAVLATTFRTFKSRGNLNSDIGLPLTLLDMPLDTQRLVMEMGMTRRGELTELAAFAKPDVAVVTNVGPSHLERLGSIEAIAAAKAELVQAIKPGGTVILNGDDPRVRDMAGLAAPGVHVVTYGLDPQHTLSASEIVSHGLDGIALRFTSKGMPWQPLAGPSSAAARLPLLGRHSVHAALAATAVGLNEGQSWAEIISGLKNLAALEVLRLVVVSGLNGATILDDTYNASPDSMLAALNLLADLPGRRIAVLGDMLELGNYTEEGHRRVARRACEVCELLVTVGSLGAIIADEAHEYGFEGGQLFEAPSKADAVTWLAERLQPGDMVLVKGSRGLHLEEVVTALMLPPGADQGGGA